MRARGTEGTSDADRLAVARALLLEPSDALTQECDLRALATGLGLPFLAVKLIEQETMSPENRSVSEQDIGEWLTWKDQQKPLDEPSSRKEA